MQPNAGTNLFIRLQRGTQPNPLQMQSLRASDFSTHSIYDVFRWWRKLERVLLLADRIDFAVRCWLFFGWKYGNKNSNIFKVRIEVVMRLSFS